VGLGRRIPGLGEADPANVALCVRVGSLGHFAAYVGRPVNPPPLLLGRPVDLPKRGLAAEGPIADDLLRRLREPPLL
jgi:hypothetical protein